MLVTPYAYKRTCVKPEHSSSDACTVASYWESDGNNDLRAKIPAKEIYRDYKVDADFGVMTLQDVGAQRTHKEGHHSDMEETASVTVNSSRSIPGGALRAKQF